MQNMFQILIPPKGLLLKLKKEAENPKEVLDQVLQEKFAELLKHFRCVEFFLFARLATNKNIQRIK